MQLLDKFPIEGGQKDPKQRIIPFLPGKLGMAPADGMGVPWSRAFSRPREGWQLHQNSGWSGPNNLHVNNPQGIRSL